MNNFNRFPHLIMVIREHLDGYPPILVDAEIVLESSCNAQVGTGGSTKNENEAMIYDWVIYYSNDITEIVEVNDLVTITRGGKTYETTVERAVQGQLTNRIWCNNVSN